MSNHNVDIINIEKHSRNKLTIAKNEVRLKLNGQDNERIVKFAHKILDVISTDPAYFNLGTLRGQFKMVDNIYEVNLRLDNGNCIVFITENSKNFGDNNESE